MGNKKSFFLLLVALVVVVAGGKLAYDHFAQLNPPPDTLQVSTPSPPAEKGATIPSSETEVQEPPAALDFTMYTPQGDPVTLSSLMGTPVVLNFWASWCPPCKLEMPYFQEAYEEMGEEVTFIMVSMTGGRESQETAEAYIAEIGYTFPIYHDLDQEAFAAYGVYSLPTSVFISPDGKIIAYQEGALSSEMLLRGIQLIQEA